MLAALSPVALIVSLPVDPASIVTDPPDSVVSVTVTVLLPVEARRTVANLLTPPRLNVPAVVSNSVLVPLPPVSVSPPTAAAETWTASFSNPPVKLSVPVPV